MLRLSILATIGLLAAQGAAISIKRFDNPEPFYDHDHNTPADCTLWWNSDDGLSCDTALLIADVTISQLTSINPSIKSCGDWKEDYSYCIQSASGFPTTTPAPGTTTPPTTTVPPTTTTSLPGNSIATPIPFQQGMTTSCNRFRKVTLDDQCASIVAEAGISLADFYSWNPAVGSKCTTLWADNYVCTGIIGSTPTEPVDNGVATPAPTQPGMTNHCNKLYLVKAGDHLRYGPVSFTPNGNAGSSAYYEAACATCPPTVPVANTCPLKSPAPSGKQCGRVGIPLFKDGMGNLPAHTENSAYVSSVGACAAKCLDTPACTSFYYTQSSRCALFWGAISFAANGNSGSHPFYEADCFSCPSTASCTAMSPPPANKHCGRVGLPVFSSASGTLISYPAGTAYVTSVGEAQLVTPSTGVVEGAIKVYGIEFL
ncbi:hypothetical protein V491_04249 [Pseudogymnoascus sp. VKM F-3775]|nr:hypothetical protein V491_04249 [Pseudogymnoascus sp. VKM F-3775]